MKTHLEFDIALTNEETYLPNETNDERLLDDFFRILIFPIRRTVYEKEFYQS